MRLLKLTALVAGCAVAAAFTYDHAHSTVAAPALAAAPASAPAAKPVVTVFKDPNCGCCKNWVEYLRANGYTVMAKDTSDMDAVKRALGVPSKTQSCHTAVVNGYVVEGHVPVADIDRLLKEKPKVTGIAAPGMPAGSPGMEMGGRHDAYDVVSFTKDGKTSVFAKH